MKTACLRICVALWISWLSGCASSPELSGIVLDRASGKPVADAYVARLIQGQHFRSVFPDSGWAQECAAAQVVRSNSEGRYRFPAWYGRPYRDTVVEVHAYKKGYRFLRPLEQVDPPDGSVKYLWQEIDNSRFIGGQSSREVASRVLFLHNRYLSGWSSDCMFSKPLFPVLRAAAQEALALAQTERERRDAIQLCRFARYVAGDKGAQNWIKPVESCTLDDLLTDAAD